LQYHYATRPAPVTATGLEPVSFRATTGHFHQLNYAAHCRRLESNQQPRVMSPGSHQTTPAIQRVGLEPTLNGIKNHRLALRPPLGTTPGGVEPPSTASKAAALPIKLRSGLLRPMGFEPTCQRRRIYSPLHHHSATVAVRTMPLILTFWFSERSSPPGMSYGNLGFRRGLRLQECLNASGRI
jgi:hypothetical protein